MDGLALLQSAGDLHVRRRLGGDAPVGAQEQHARRLRPRNVLWFEVG